MIQNAGIFGSDSIVLDLEDAVSVDRKRFCPSIGP